MALAQPNTQQSALIPQLAPAVIALTPSSIQTSAHFVHIKSPEDDDGLGALIRNHTAQKHEKREIEIKHTSKMERVLRKFCYFLNHTERKISFWYEEADEYLDRRITEVLTPDEIKVMFQAMLYKTEDEQKRNCDNLIDWESGRFISKLIQLSYDAGYNDFELDTRDTKNLVSNIGEKLRGSEEKLIKLMIHGDVGNLCFSSSYFEIDLDGNIPYETNSDYVGRSSKHGIFILRGKSQEIISYFGSDITYKTNNKGILPRLIFCALEDKRKDIFTREYNQIVFITPNGREDIIMRYEPNVNITFHINQKYRKFFEKQVLEKKYWKEYNIKMVDNLSIRPLG